MLTTTCLPSVVPSSRRRTGPFGELWRLHDQMDRAFTGTWSGGTARYPELDARSNDDEVVIRAELPGFAPGDVDISLEQNVLTLKGAREAEEKAEGEVYHRQERWTGEFSRALELPYEVDGGKVEAEFSNGVLTIKLPRAEEHRPKRIEIRAS